ncbi:ATP-dependent RecD-like DNA helicase [Fervidicola ferrireducens]|uniref:ATP-dependent RecD2 DNA helicase n=1 Tax=Fervidicola ferrireducens TaxID=520764 RepID=A0A140L2U0_9FIRM|nr:ATP-dependent RecD-like DNA helicase [Fervidicola ferrireducens]KXG74865.1 ATP-dependent RecD-like DNA helicase [Fervidicola ferrireducens]
MQVLNGCRVEKVIYSNPDTQYTVARVKHGQDDVVVVLFERCYEGEKLDVVGSWVEHPKYGKQFKASHVERSRELTEADVMKLLQGIKGIGPARAEAIVSRYGVRALEVAQQDPEQFRGLVPESVIENIREEFRADSVLNALKSKLVPLGITPNMVRKIYRRYGERAFEVLEKNPYKLAEDVKGIGYKKADEIALKLGMDPKSEERVTACVRYVLSKAAAQGHVYLPKKELVAKVLEETKQAIATPRILECMRNNRETEEEADRVYLKYLYHYETAVARKLAKLNEAGIAAEIKAHAGAVMDGMEREQGMKYTSKQRMAVERAFQYGASIITGGPGTGKTTVIKAIIEVAKANRLVVELAAPTGRAAKRMEEVTGHPAKTIHRLLEYQPDGTEDELEGELRMDLRFGRDETNPIDADLIIVDEASMIDTVLMYHLVMAVKEGSGIVFVGDGDQLPSIGPGDVLTDMMEYLPTTKLDVIFRQAELSGIVLNAGRINRGQYPYFNGKDFCFYEYESPEQIVNLYEAEVKTGAEVQVLTPVKRTEAGTANLNRLIQERVNPADPGKPQVVFRDKVFRVGDRVMQQTNDYGKECFNGDVGIVKDIYKDTQDGCIRMVVEYPHKEVTYIDDEVGMLELAYAITVHKSQGSQYDTVIVPLITSHYIMLKRNLLYTAITRAVNKVIIVGQKKAIWIAVNTIDAEKRYTTLAERLKGLMSGQLQLTVVR